MLLRLPMMNSPSLDGYLSRMVFLTPIGKNPANQEYTTLV